MATGLSRGRPRGTASAAPGFGRRRNRLSSNRGSADNYQQNAIYEIYLVHNISPWASLDPATRILKIKSFVFNLFPQIFQSHAVQLVGLCAISREHTLEIIQQAHDAIIAGMSPPSADISG